VQQLAAHGTDRRPGDALDLELSGPAAGSQHDSIGRQRPAGCLDDDAVWTTRNSARLPFNRPGRVTAGGHRQRARQLDRVHEAVRFDEQAAGDFRAQMRFLRSRRARIEQAERDAAALQPIGEILELRHVLAARGHLQRAGPLVADRQAGRRHDAFDEPVVQVEAAHGELEEGVVAILGFCKRREHAGRRLRGPHGGKPAVEHPHRGAAARQFPGHGASDDAGANDDDVGGT